MALKQDGSVWGTGNNVNGQLGDGSNYDASLFFKIMSGVAKTVAAGFGHSMILTQDGVVWTTGENMFGQLGDGTTISKSTFESCNAVSVGA